jgi:phage terminase large subunit-like protein
VCPGRQIDHRQIVQEVLQLAKAYDIRTLQADRHNALQSLLELKEAGINVVDHQQGTVSMNDPCKSFECLVLARELIHDGNPVLTWAIGNCPVRRDRQGNIAPDKGGTAEGKIDPLVALVMAISGAISTPPEKELSDKPPINILFDNGEWLFPFEEEYVDPRQKLLDRIRATGGASREWINAQLRLNRHAELGEDGHV